MNWEALDAIVGVVAVVATLGCLAVQIRQNSQADPNPKSRSKSGASFLTMRGENWHAEESLHGATDRAGAEAGRGRGASPLGDGRCSGVAG